jgi:hypothetical protein
MAICKAAECTPVLFVLVLPDSSILNAQAFNKLSSKHCTKNTSQSYMYIYIHHLLVTKECSQTKFQIPAE